MKLQRIIRTCTVQTFGDVFVAAVGHTLPRIVKAVVYLSVGVSAAAGQIRAAIRTLGYAGATEVVAVEPMGQPGEILIVIWLVDAAMTPASPAPDVTVVRTSSYDVAWFGNAGRSAEYETVFAGAQGKLRAAGMSVAHLWKTWSYLPVDASSGRADESFVKFNQQRAAWFEGIGFHIEAATPDAPFAFPANTGVGDFAGYFSLSGIAGRARDGLARVVEVDNPQQQSPRNYGTGQSGRRTPAHFSRAVGVLAPDDCWILVAGTASVVGCATANIDVVVGQTTQTLANLATLAAQARERGKQGLGGQMAPISEVYKNLVVYVTHADDLDAIRQTVESAAREIPVIYLRCPLTRADLLVEMEGELA
jgi:hypothetical protein